MGLLEIVSVFFSLTSFTHPGYLEIPLCCGVDMGVVFHSVMYLGCVSAHLQVALGFYPGFVLNGYTSLMKRIIIFLHNS